MLYRPLKNGRRYARQIILKLYQTQSRPAPRRTAGSLVGNNQAATFSSPYSKARVKTRCATSNLPYPGTQHCAAQVIKQLPFIDTQRKRPPPAHLFSQSRDFVATKLRPVAVAEDCHDCGIVLGWKSLAPGPIRRGVAMWVSMSSYRHLAIMLTVYTCHTRLSRKTADDLAGKCSGWPVHGKHTSRGREGKLHPAQRV